MIRFFGYASGGPKNYFSSVFVGICASCCVFFAMFVTNN